MLNLSPILQVFLAVQPVDPRKDFDGYNAVLRTDFDPNGLDGNLFLFPERRRERATPLRRDRNGLNPMLASNWDYADLRADGWAAAHAETIREYRLQKARSRADGKAARRAWRGQQE